MQFTTSALALLAGLLSTAAALPAPAPAADAADYQWHIDNFGYGCSPGGCSGGGTITGGAHKGAPAFEATCEATGYDTTYVKCKGKKHGDDMHFWFNDDSSETLIVHFRYKAAGKTFQATKTIPTPPYEESVNFTMKPRKK